MIHKQCWLPWRSRLLRREPLKACNSASIDFASEVFLQSALKYSCLGFHEREQSHTRPEFEIVGINKNFRDFESVDLTYDLSTLDQSRPEDWMVQIRLRLFP